MADANIFESISDRPLKNLFSIFGILVGSGISKFLTRTFIVYPTFTDPNTAGLSAGALTVIVILASAWLNGKFGVYVAAKINARDSTKSIKTSIAWGVSIVSFILYLFAAGLFSEFSRINAPLQTQRQNKPESQQAPYHDQQPVKPSPVVVDPFASIQPATPAQTNPQQVTSNDLLKFGGFVLNVSDEIKATWTAVKLHVVDKVAKNSKDYIVAIGSTLEIPDTRVKVNVLAFLPDYRYDGKSISASASNKPNNPAALILIREPAEAEWTGFIYSLHPEIHPYQHDKIAITLIDGVMK